MRELSWFEHGHGASNDAVASLEREIGFDFPEDYRQFLIAFAGAGNPDESSFNVIDKGRPFAANFGSVLSVAIGENDSVRETMTNLGDSLMPGIVPIISTGMGDLVCLDFRNGMAASVVYYNHNRPLENSIIPLAHNFTIFLDMLEITSDEE
jgi:cell wall assembly regulator SMI1